MPIRPNLIPVDLMRCTQTPGGGGYSDHPDIDEGRRYLVQYDGLYYVGRFSRQWYGWNFEGVYPTGVQLDKPGTNSSAWEGLWEIERPKRKGLTKEEVIAMTPRRVHLAAAERPTRGPFARDPKYRHWHTWGVCGSPTSKVTDDPMKVTCLTCQKLLAKVSTMGPRDEHGE
jgi:hypothetical protein